MKKYIIAVLLLVCVVGFGCNRTLVSEGSYAPVKVDSAKLRLNSVSILDESISNKLSVNATDSRRTDTGTLEVWAIIVNRTSHPQQIEARVQFFDVQKAPIDGPSSWKRLPMSANASVTYKMSSLQTDRVGYYHIEVREAR